MGASLESWQPNCQQTPNSHCLMLAVCVFFHGAHLEKASIPQTRINILILMHFGSLLIAHTWEAEILFKVSTGVFCATP